MKQDQTPDYDQLFEQIHRLPQDDFEKLVRVLSHELQASKPGAGKDMQSLILGAPTWSDEQWDAYQGARNFINQSRLA